ncbi:MAG: PLP-dependent aminotransferase family protein [Bacteroidota bacterium]
MLPAVDKKSGKPLTRQVYEFFQSAIIEGQLSKGDRLPSIRLLAKDLAVSNNTIISAYQQMVDEGYVENHLKKGFYVAALDPSIVPSVRPASKKLKPADQPKIKFDLRHANVDEANFPLKEWRKMQQLALNKFSYQYSDYFGEQSLKEQLCHYLYRSRGVVAEPKQVVIGAGVNTMMNILALLFRDTRKRIVVEEPGYYEIRKVFAAADYKLIPTPVNSSGLRLDKLRSVKTDLVYITPSHQYPTGAIMPVSNRLNLLRWAHDTGTFIIEDDYDSEFRHRGNPIPSLQGMDKGHRVIYVSTFSKALTPALRMAYMVLPLELTDKLNDVTIFSQTVPGFVQRATALFMEHGYWDQHLRKMRKIYQQKYYASLAALEKVFGNSISLTPSHAGLSILFHVENRLSDTMMIQKALRQGILINSDRLSWTAPVARPGIFFGFGKLDTEKIEEAVAQLKKSWLL